MNKEQRIAELKAELKALEAEVQDPLHKRAQEILDIMYPEKSVWREKQKYLPDMFQYDQYQGAKVYYVDENQSNRYRVIGFIYKGHYSGRDEETEVEVPKSFFETDNLKEEIYKHFFQENKQERIGSLETRIDYKEKELQDLIGNIADLKVELEIAKKDYGDE